MKNHYQYLIVGGGMAAEAAMRGIRDVDSEGAIGVISSDPEPPYQRPWLSKALWKGESIDGIWLPVPDGIDLHLGRTVEQLELDENQVRDDQGNVFGFDSLLLATGVRPRHIVPDGDRIIGFRGLAHYRKLAELAKHGTRFAIVGGGFIGSELAAALSMNGKEVDLIFPGSTIGDRVYPEGLSNFITDRYRKEGVHVHSGTKVGMLTERNDGVLVELTGSDGAKTGEIAVDAVVTGIGSELNDELAKAAGLPVDNGILVDASLRAGRPNVYAAGDIARYFQSSLNKHIRVEHENNALRMGKAAGRAMAGQGKPYDYLPFFYSDLFDMGYEAVGELDTRHAIVEDWIRPCEEGVIYYLDGNQVRGVLLWNHWDKLSTARKMVGTDLPEKGEGLRAAILES